MSADIAIAVAIVAAGPVVGWLVWRVLEAASR
jgi:hypothetical protein